MCENDARKRMSENKDIQHVFGPKPRPASAYLPGVPSRWPGSSISSRATVELENYAPIDGKAGSPCDRHRAFLHLYGGNLQVHGRSRGHGHKVVSFMTLRLRAGGRFEVNFWASPGSGFRKAGKETKEKQNKKKIPLASPIRFD